VTAATNRECDKRSYANKLLSIASAVFLALAVLQGTGAAWAQEGEEASETVNAADAASQENSASIDPSSSIDATETAGGDAADAVRSGFEPMATVYVSNRDQLATAISTAADGDIIYVQSNIDMGGSGLGVGGSRSLTIASDMAAPGAPFTITVDRGRHFIIGNGADIAINDLTLEGAGLSGWPTGPLSAPSGGFDVIDASLALTNVTVRNCFNDPSGAPAYNSWGHGGAIFVTSSVSTASLTVVSSRFLGNSAFMQAGAIFAEGDAVLDIGGTTEFTDNTTLTENGGAISVGDNVQVSLSDSVSFLGNDGCAGGGGINIYGNASLTTIGDLLFEDNEAGRGGGIISPLQVP
jgi:predicted outer membrane repeat protein